jgi:glycosyltransferase involved in cell wall biosynthesis
MGPLSQQRAHEFAEELAAASAIIVPSDAHRTALSLHVREKISVVPLGIPYRKPEQHLKPQEKSSLCVLHFGHLSELKGTNILLRAVKLLQAEGRDVHLILAGSELGTTLDLSHVEVIPKYDWDSLVALAARSDVAVFPSLARETYGLVVETFLVHGFQEATAHLLVNLKTSPNNTITLLLVNKLHHPPLFLHFFFFRFFRVFRGLWTVVT